MVNKELFKEKYYYLVAGLPEIFFEDTKLPITLDQLKKHLEENLEGPDLDLIANYFLRYDNHNLLKILRNEEEGFSPLGNFDKETLEGFVSVLKADPDAKEEAIPSYFRQFIPGYLKEVELFPEISWENQLSWLYYDFLFENTHNSFVYNWYEFELNIKNIMVALNCRKYKLEVDKQVIGNNTVAQQIRESNAKDFGLNNLIQYYEDLVRIFEYPNLLEKEQKVDLLKWNYLDEHTFFEYFTIERLFAFTVKLEILQRWLHLNKENGEKIFREAMQHLESSYSFPEEFIIKK